jgi:hypothetical protein
MKGLLLGVLAKITRFLLKKNFSMFSFCFVCIPTQAIWKRNCPAPKANAHSCLSFQLKQEVEINDGNHGTLWLLPPLLIKIQPEKSQSVVVPISSDVQGKWLWVKLAVSRIRTPFKLLFQQAGPTQQTADETTSFTNRSTPTLRVALGDMRIFSGSCKVSNLN